jgi:hypothetical protein
MGAAQDMSEDGRKNARNRIIELAQQGERDPIRLREGVAKGV